MSLRLEPFEGTCPVLVREYGAWHPLSGSELEWAMQPVGGNQGLVARMAGVAVGVAAARTWAAKTPQDEWAMCSLAVAPAVRGKGVGAALLDGLLAMGLPELRFLEVDAATATHLLTSRGFEQLDFGDAHYLHDVAAAVEPRGSFMHVAVPPEDLREQVTELGRQYNTDTEMPEDFDVFEGFADPTHGFLTLGVSDGQAWGVGVSATLVAPGWGASQRLLVAGEQRGQGRGTQLKLAQVQGARERGWSWVYCGSPGVEHPAGRANAAAGGRLVTGNRWRQAADRRLGLAGGRSRIHQAGGRPRGAG